METLEALCFVGVHVDYLCAQHAHKKAGIRKLYSEDHDDRDKGNRATLITYRRVHPSVHPEPT